MKKCILYSCIVTLVLLVAGCSGKRTGNEIPKKNEKIEMIHNSEFYIGDDWTIESLAEHFKELGFTTIEEIASSPDDDNYQKNIFELYVCTGTFGSADTWEEGEEFKPDTKIKIYYNESPILTMDNCEDFKCVLTSSSIPYDSFTALYDGRYVEFEAIVTENLQYWGDLGNVITVKGDGVNGLEIQIGDKTYGHNIDTSVEEGDTVIVRGRIDNRETEYFERLYVETFELKRK